MSLNYFVFHTIQVVARATKLHLHFFFFFFFSFRLFLKKKTKTNNRWMDDLHFTSFSTVFQTYQHDGTDDHERQICHLKIPFATCFNGLRMFRFLAVSHQETSHLLIGEFATRYFSHLSDPRRFATALLFAVDCLITVS